MNPLKLENEADFAAPAAELTKLDEVLQLNHTSSIRKQIGMIADRSFREGVINSEAYQGYRELAEGREQFALDPKMLENTKKFAQEHEARAIRVHAQIEEAKRAKIASKMDEAFLMEKLVVDNLSFVQQADQIETLISQKLDRMKKDRENYDKLANHKLAKNVGYFKVAVDKRFKIPSEAKYLTMTVPERRKWLEQAEKALGVAEEFAKQSDIENSEVLTKAYDKKLQAALDSKVIGQKTFLKFKDGFSKIDNEEKEYWISEFDTQMQRYEDLWNNIRSTLKGPALAGLEAKRDEKGYTDLLTAFEVVGQQEARRLGAQYATALSKYEEEGIIGNHTVAKFNAWMVQQDLAGKYEAAGQLGGEMKRYKELWANIATLKPKHQAALKARLHQWGYTELKAEYKRLESGAPEASEEGSETLLSQVDTAAARKAILSTKKTVEKKGAGQKSRFTRLLQLFEGQSANDYENNVRQRKVNSSDSMTELLGEADDASAEERKTLRMSYYREDGKVADFSHRETKVLKKLLESDESDDELEKAA